MGPPNDKNTPHQRARHKTMLSQEQKKGEEGHEQASPQIVTRSWTCNCWSRSVSACTGSIVHQQVPLDQLDVSLEWLGVNTLSGNSLVRGSLAHPGRAASHHSAIRVGWHPIDARVVIEVGVIRCRDSLCPHAQSPLIKKQHVFLKLGCDTARQTQFITHSFALAIRGGEG